MTFAFQHHHGAMLLKYSGISFISGAVNHGFFSGERSLWTAAVGIVLFVLGAAMEHRLSDTAHEQGSSLFRTLLLGALLSVGLGFFTGGLQHFPDSPARSAWVVPLGFLISVPALALNSPLDWRRGSTLYTVLLGLGVMLGSYGAWQWLERNPQYLGSHGHSHSHDAADDHGHDAAPQGLVAQVVSRSIEVRMDDTMRFAPDSLQVQAGETIRLVVHNAGKVEHELVLGTDEDIREHAEALTKRTDHSHSHAGGAAISLAPGRSGELGVTFPKAGTVQMACLIPGHYEAGMRGRVQVSDAVTPAKPASKGHDHSTHKH
ncbi:MAG: plastocyanin/azurin family copper-binding protein [Limnohabitans sp.]